MQETWVRFLGREDPLEKEMTTHSSILAWRIPRSEEPSGYSPQGRKESDTTELTHAKKRLGNRTCCLSQNQFWPFILSQDIEKSSWGRKELLKVLKLAHTLRQESANFTYKGADGNNLVLVGHKVFVTTTYLWCGVQKWAEMIHQGKSMPIKFIYKSPRWTGFSPWPVIFHFTALQCQMLISNEWMGNKSAEME